MPRLTPGRHSGDFPSVRPHTHLTADTPRRRAEPQLIRTPSFVIAYGFDADAPAPVLRWASEGMRTILGYGASALLSGWLMDAVHGEDVDMIVARHLAALEGRVETVEARFLSAEGVVRHLRGELSLADPDDSTRGGIAHWTDVTTERAARELLARREEELWSARRLSAVGELAGSIAHDCGNLLTAIRAYAELLKADLGESKHRDDLDAIARSADNASALVRQLLNLGRQGNAQPRLVSVDELVVAFERVLLRLVGNACTLRVDPGQAGFVHADPAMIEHVLLNLVVSARDAMPNGGQIAIGTDRASLGIPFSQAGGAIPAGTYPEVRVSFSVDATTRDAIVRAVQAGDAPDDIDAEPIGVATAATMIRRAGGWLIAEAGRDGACVLRMLFASCVVTPEPFRGALRGGRRHGPHITPPGGSAA